MINENTATAFSETQAQIDSLVTMVLQNCQVLDVLTAQKSGNLCITRRRMLFLDGSKRPGTIAY